MAQNIIRHCSLQEEAYRCFFLLFSFFLIDNDLFFKLQLHGGISRSMMPSVLAFVG